MNRLIEGKVLELSSPGMSAHVSDFLSANHSTCVEPVYVIWCGDLSHNKEWDKI